MYSYKDFDIKKEETKLSNGVPLMLLYRKGAPVYTQVSFFSGSRFDPIGKEGLAHFAEHMIVSGSKTFPSKDRLAVYTEEVGGIFGAGTSHDVLSIKIEMPDKDDFPNTVNLLKEILTNSLFEEKTILTERGSILREISGKVADPSKQIWVVFDDLIFQGTKVGRATTGTPESVENITRNDLITFYEKMLTTGRAAIVVSGDIELKSVVKEFEENLVLRESTKIKSEGNLPTSRRECTKIHGYPQQEHVHFVLGFRTTGNKNPDDYPLSVLSEIFGGGRASVLSKRLRYEKGLVYGVSASNDSFVDAGAWYVKSSTAKDKLQETVDIITEELHRIHSGKISQAELDFAKNKTIKSSKRRMQTSASWAVSHMYDFLIGNKEGFPDFLNNISQVTLEDLARVGKRCFKPGTWYLAVCGDPEAAKVTINY